MLQLHLRLPATARKECLKVLQWVILARLTLAAYMDSELCHRFFRSVIMKVFLPRISPVFFCTDSCSLFFPPHWFHGRQLCFSIEVFYIFVFRCFVWGHVYCLHAPCDNWKDLTKTQLNLGHIAQALLGCSSIDWPTIICHSGLR